MLSRGHSRKKKQPHFFRSVWRNWEKAATINSRCVQTILGCIVVLTGWGMLVFFWSFPSPWCYGRKGPSQSFFAPAGMPTVTSTLSGVTGVSLWKLPTANTSLPRRTGNLLLRSKWPVSAFFASVYREKPGVCNGGSIRWLKTSWVGVIGTSLDGGKQVGFLVNSVSFLPFSNGRWDRTIPHEVD